ncbi:hypothetical protein [Streptomyces sp. NPDC048332]|uniref:hypothetical protein n=1 Tax=Streptomyces sp. NPDC048332 TaxID=3154619 RepID=UPI00344AF251
MPGQYPQQHVGFGAPPPGGRRPGRAARGWGAALIVLGVFPLLAGLLVVGVAFSNSKSDEFNQEFAAKSWHNLRSDQIFPAHLEDTSIIQKNTGWTRQGILGDGSCEKNLKGPFREQAKTAGCVRVMAATYVDDTGKTAATVALVVTRSYKDAEALAGEFESTVVDRKANDLVEPPVPPLAVARTPAAEWQAFGGAVRAVGLSTTSAPFVVAVTAGPTDLNRHYGKLPGDWEHEGPPEVRVFPKIADHLAGIYSRSFPNVIEGKEKSWGA